MDYTQVTPRERDEMLQVIGVESIEDLFSPIPADGRFQGELKIPPAAAELDLQRELAALAEMNVGAHTHATFMGAGSYDHFVPVLIDQLISRGEFLTSYTPYQAEALQGTLQAFFEFQTQVARLTDMDIANASLYDGASSVAEAVILALNTTGKRRVLVASTVHPDTRSVLETYLDALPVDLIELPHTDRRVPADTVRHAMDDDVACVVVQSPNFFGCLEDWDGCFEAAHEKPRTLAVAVFNPIACAMLKTPGECGADLAVGEGQPLGIPHQYGGPYLGLFAARENLMRKMPGRLIGQTQDTEGRRAFCLVLQTREQHIRKEKATSNICTNQGLLAMRATMFMNAMGPAGLREMAEQSYHKAHYLADQIAALPGYDLGSGDADFFNEFVLRTPGSARDLMDAAKRAGFILGPDLSDARAGRVGQANELLVAVTEKRTREELDGLVEFLRTRSDA